MKTKHFSSKQQKKFRVAVIVEQFPALSETFILDHIIGLMGLGHDVEIFAFSKPKANEKIHERVWKYKLLERTHYIYNVPTQRWPRLYHAIRIFCRYFFQHPLIMLQCLDVWSYKKWEIVNNFIKVEPFLKKPFDIIHCHFGTTGNKIIRLKRFFPKTVFLTTFHGFDMSAVFSTEDQNCYDQLLEKGDLFLPISNFWKEKLERLGCPEEKIITHHMGIDLSRFLFETRTRTRKNNIMLLTVGRLVEKKGHEFVIRAIVKVVKKYPQLMYMIAGDGPYRSELQNLVEEFSLGDHIKFVGSVEQNEVSKLYQEADIFVLSSVTAEDGDQEGIPVVLMEAMAAQLPVISTFHSGIPELIEDGKNGFLVHERDVFALAEKIEFLIEHPEIVGDMGKKGRDKVESAFNTEMLNRRLEDIYYASCNGGDFHFLQ